MPPPGGLTKPSQLSLITPFYAWRALRVLCSTVLYSFFLGHNCVNISVVHPYPNFGCFVAGTITDSASGPVLSLAHDTGSVWVVELSKLTGVM